MQLVYLFKGLELAPPALERIVSLVPESAFDSKNDPGRFSFREAVAHVADWESINLDRLHRGVEEPGCTVPGYDEGLLAVERNYQTWDPREQVRRFAEGREKVMAYLRGLSDEEWERVYYHAERGRQTVFEQAVTILGHDMYHLEQLTQYLS